MVLPKMRWSCQKYRNKNRKWCLPGCWGGKNRWLLANGCRYLVVQDNMGSGDR